MQYTFLEDLDKVRSNYESFRDELLKYDVIDSNGATTSSGFSEVGKQYLTPEENNASGYGSPLPVRKNSTENIAKTVSKFSDNVVNVDEAYENEDDSNGNVGGSRKVRKAMRKTEKESGDKESWLTKGGEGFTTENIIDAAGLGIQIGSAFGNTSSSEGESWAQTGNFAMKGAQIGFGIGGPLGAAIGGVAGLAAGVVDMFGDTTKRNTAKRNSINAKNDELKTKRQLQYAVDTQSDQLKKLQALRKSQLNYLDVKL